MAGRVGGLPDLAAVRGVLLHEGRVAGHLAALHRLARRAVPVDPGKADRRQVLSRVVDLDQGQVRAGPVYIPGEPRVGRGGELPLVGVAD